MQCRNCAASTFANWSGVGGTGLVPVVGHTVGVLLLGFVFVHCHDAVYEDARVPDAVVENVIGVPPAATSTESPPFVASVAVAPVCADADPLVPEATVMPTPKSAVSRLAPSAATMRSAILTVACARATMMPKATPCSPLPTMSDETEKVLVVFVGDTMSMGVPVLFELVLATHEAVAPLCPRAGA